MTNALAALHGRAKAAHKHIVLSEGDDPRVQDAASRAVAEGLAEVTIIGSGLPAIDGVRVEDPATSDLRGQLATAFQEARAKKSPTREQAEEAINDRLVFAALMVRAGLADGTVGGAVETTAATVRAAIQMIGVAKGAPLVSSFFLMVLPDSHPERPGEAIVFTDCGLVVDPSPEELAAIASQGAASYAQLVGGEPKVAMLSFSTLGSARHARVTKVTTALTLAREAGLTVDGELQFDSAFDAGVGSRKAPNSDVAGQANVMVFPDLDAGNIGYKIAQRIGGATAIGPVLQGLAKPANDLSRGCTADDIVDIIAVTAVQAG